MTDYNRDTIMAMAEKALRDFGGEVHFKFTCAHCGTRCTLADANLLYEEGECCNCGRMTKIEMAGFSLLAPLGRA